MNRKDFGKILNATVIPEWASQEEVDNLLSPIADAKVQMMPDSLFRFRAFDSFSLDAFRSGKIYMRTADKYNDPYDTLGRYDLEEIKKGVNAMVSCETLGRLKEWLEQGHDFSEHFKQIFPGEMVKAFREKLLSIEDVKTVEEGITRSKILMISSIETWFPVISEMSKRLYTTACFCEDVQNMLMWSHYADSHRGFALEYDFRTLLKHPINNVGLYPVVYGEERVDVSTFIGWMFLYMNGVTSKKPDIFSTIKNSLFKSSVWEYEKEWRLIDFSPREVTDDMASAISYEPVAIYYGRHISKENKQMLHSIAQEKGIKEYEMFVDYASSVYEMRWRVIREEE